MNIQNGLKRIFLLVSIVVSIWGFIVIAKQADNYWSTQIRYHLTSWSEEDINKYYVAAKNAVKSHTQDKFSYLQPVVNPEDLPEYNKNPPKYNEGIFEKAFPKTNTTSYLIYITSGLCAALLTFIICYSALIATMFFTTIIFAWIINGFLNSHLKCDTRKTLINL